MTPHGQTYQESMKPSFKGSHMFKLPHSNVHMLKNPWPNLRQSINVFFGALFQGSDQIGYRYLAERTLSKQVRFDHAH